MDFAAIIYIPDWNAQATTSAVVLLMFLLLEALQNLIAYIISPSIFYSIKKKKTLEKRKKIPSCSDESV